VCLCIRISRFFFFLSILGGVPFFRCEGVSKRNRTGERERGENVENEYDFVNVRWLVKFVRRFSPLVFSTGFLPRPTQQKTALTLQQDEKKSNFFLQTIAASERTKRKTHTSLLLTPHQHVFVATSAHTR